MFLYLLCKTAAKLQKKIDICKKKEYFLKQFCFVPEKE